MFVLCMSAHHCHASDKRVIYIWGQDVYNSYCLINVVQFNVDVECVQLTEGWTRVQLTLTINMHVVIFILFSLFCFFNE